MFAPHLLVGVRTNPAEDFSDGVSDADFCTGRVAPEKLKYECQVGPTTALITSLNNLLKCRNCWLINARLASAVIQRIEKMLCNFWLGSQWTLWLLVYPKLIAAVVFKLLRMSSIETIEDGVDAHITLLKNR